MEFGQNNKQYQLLEQFSCTDEGALPILFQFCRNSSTKYVILVQKVVNPYLQCASESPRGSVKNAFARAKSYSDPECLGWALEMWIFITCGIRLWGLP